jgi:hypothetical protein
VENDTASADVDIKLRPRECLSIPRKRGSGLVGPNVRPKGDPSSYDIAFFNRSKGPSVLHTVIVWYLILGLELDSYILYDHVGRLPGSGL